MRIPELVRNGDTVIWLDEPTVDVFGQVVDATNHTLVYYLRANGSAAAETLTATAQGSKWRLTWVANETITTLTTFYWQAVATKISDSSKTTLGSGSLVLEPSLAYTGTATTYISRSQAEKDLEAVQSAIRTLLAGGSTKEYRIGNRSIKRYDIAELLQLEGKLKADVAREKKAEMIANGLGNPRNMFVRFNA